MISGIPHLPLFVVCGPMAIRPSMAILTIFGHFWPSGQYACSLSLRMHWVFSESALSVLWVWSAGVLRNPHFYGWGKGEGEGEWYDWTEVLQRLNGWNQMGESSIYISPSEFQPSPDSSGVRAGGEIQWMWSAIWPCLLNSSDGRTITWWYDDTQCVLHMVVWCFFLEVS